MTVKKKTTTLIGILFQTILNKNDNLTIDNSIVFIRSLRKGTENLKATGQLAKKLSHFKDWMQNPICHSVRQEGKLNYFNFQQQHLELLKLFKVFQVFHPLLSPIAPYPYLFTQWPHPFLCSTHVNTKLLTIASIR